MLAGDKRARDDADVSLFAPPTGAALRAALAARCSADSPPSIWRAAITAAGVSGADAFLCYLGRSIATSLQTVTVNAETARAQLRTTRLALITAVNSRCDELEERINDAESTKITALEHELCAVDAILERLRAERGAAAEATASLDDAELLDRHGELAARLDAAEAQLLALPTSVVEPPHVGLVIDESALLAGITALGRVVAPSAITLADLTLESAPRRAWSGCILKLDLILQSAPHASQSAEELEVSMGAIAASTHIEASLETEGRAPQHLHTVAIADVLRRRVSMSIEVPSGTQLGSSVCLGPLTVSGKPVAGFPLRIKTTRNDLSPQHAAQLQAWLPPGGSSRPDEWEEVYRATIHGFQAKAFHARCDRRARLLVLVREKRGGWCFGGFTAVGFRPPQGWYADPGAFLFSLTNSLGRPEKLDSRRTGSNIYYGPSLSATFGDFLIFDSSDVSPNSYTKTGQNYAESASMGTHPMSRGYQKGWLAAEVIAWVV